jgi:translation initiation factor eIF-2B subunit epsilon
MPPKQKKPTNQGDDDAEKPFQAVVLTDYYDEQFLPISHEMPRVTL